MKFKKVDQGFRQVARIIETDPRLSALLQSTRLQPMLDSIAEQLLACQTALNQYIDEKRSTFPRLYFLSDDDLLELLGQARAGADGRAAVMQTHLKKLFPGATGVNLGPGDMSITALRTHHGETFQLDHPVDIDCPVEVWLKNLETEMRSSLKSMTLKCVKNSSQSQDPFSLPTQILCLAQNIKFTEQAEKAITSRDLHKLNGNIEKENGYYSSAEVEDESERNKRQALILQCAHYKTVIRALIDNNVTSTGDWLWQKQLRFYLSSNDEVVAKMGLAQISYSYEYLGANTGQFVRTEIADDCFLILTQALHLGLVGNPFGPAGTGKTESIKALGGLFGRLVLVFNCDEAMDAECMGRLLTGLALSGAWGCFDEFNRLSSDTLATVAVQLDSLLTASQRDDSTNVATLNGKQVAVSPWCGVAATMNPVGRGYGGRRSLPAALRRVMRPVSVVPPLARTLAARLLAASTPYADTVACDLHDVFTMASALVSEERHYDWGLRALKSAIGACGPLAAADSVGAARAALRRLLLRANVSKLTGDAAERFENILSLVFADVPPEETPPDPIKTAVEASVENLKLAHNELQVQKCVELYEQLQQRMGVVIVGPPGSGKTTIRRLLKNALTYQGKNIVEYTICPKAMSRDWLLGNIDHDTRQWTDGVISATALEVSNQPSDVWSWVVCDGDIDPEWVEALNSVLDDNRLLTLPSGWRVQFGANVNFVFETRGLQHASPATVSRMGVILISDDVSCDLELLSNWTQRTEVDSEVSRDALPLLKQIVTKCMQWIDAHKSDLIVKVHKIIIVKQILVQFAYISQNINTDRITAEEIVYLAVERSIMNVLKGSAVDSLHDELSSTLGPHVSESPVSEWLSDSLLLSPRLTAAAPVMRACLANYNEHLLFIGPDACAKNILAEYIIKESNSPLIIIDCTPILEPADIIAELKRNNAVRSIDQSTNDGARATLFVRGLHRAPVDMWGTSAVHSFLMQVIEYSGFWQRSASGSGSEGAVQWRAVRVRVICTAVLPPPCLRAAMSVHVVPEADEDELSELIKTWLQQNVHKNLQTNEIFSLAATILAMYKEVTETYHSRPQYIWNASHLKRWCENVKWYSPTNMEELLMALTAEANTIFRDRMETDEEKSAFAKIVRKHLKWNNDDLYFNCKARSDGFYLESVDYGLWRLNTEKLINQCLTEYDYNIFGDSGAEVCSELAVLCPAMARVSEGGMLTCVSSAGAGRRAAALISAATLSATPLFVMHQNNFCAVMKNALSTAGSGTRTIVSICSGAVSDAALSAVEALRLAQHPHALPPLICPAHLGDQDMDNIKKNLGIVICLDKRQDNLQEIMEKYPMLYNDAHLLWIDKWSHNTLREMPTLVIQRLSKEDAKELSKDDLNAIPTDGFVKIHNSVEAEWLRAPCRYVAFIKAYYNIVTKKRAALLQRQSMLSSGVEALRRARTEVGKLQAEAAEQEALLSEKQAQANRALDQISATVRANTDKKDEMHALKANIEKENEKLQIQKKEIEAELASVEPVIAAARAAVGDIRPESLSEVRSLRAPPDVVRDVLEGVLRLMGIADTSWHSMKNFLSKRGVKEDIRCLDASQISASAVSSVERLVSSRSTSFSPAAARRASAAVAPLAAWVRANLDYARALARVQPLLTHQAELHRSLKEAEHQLSALSTGLGTVEERVSALKEELSQHSRDAAACELRLAAASQTLNAAKELLEQLKHEYTAWENDLENISKEISGLTQRSLLAAAYIIYLPEATESESKEHIKKWGELIGFNDSTFTVINFLSSVEKQLSWEADGLSSDESAMKNAVLIDQVLDSPKTGLTPLIIDPDGEGLAWLRRMLADKPSDFVSQHSDKLITAVQYAVRLSRILVITDVDNIDESWASLVRGVSVVQTSCSLLLCGRTVPHCTSQLSYIHFTARIHPLTDQMISYTLQKLNPDISEKSKEIKLQKAKLKKEQHELQESLLRSLSRSSDILHDNTVTAALQATRDVTNAAAALAQTAQSLHTSTSTAQNSLQASAALAAKLTLAVRQVAVKRPLVVLPVDVALDVFYDAVKREDQANINSDELIKYFTRRIIERVLLALHKKDKYIVVLHLLKQVYEDLMPDKLWQIFIGNTEINADGFNTSEIKKLHPWIPEGSLKGVAKLKAADEDLYNRLSFKNEEDWKQFISSGDINMLGKYKLSAFENVVAVAAVRPDSLYRAIMAFVDNLLGAGATRGVDAVSAAARWARSRPALMLAPQALAALQPRAPRATLLRVEVESGREAWESAVREARAQGGWVALSVGSAPFTPELHSFIADFATSPVENANEDFRLWILSEYREVPPLVANACVNVVLESPEGVKNNVLSTLSTWGGARTECARLLACLALFHALVQERRAYIPYGWSRWYGWEWSEVASAARAIRSGAGSALICALYSARVETQADAAALAALGARALPPPAAPRAWTPTIATLPPATDDLQVYASAFSSLPELDSPQLLCLAANCRAAWETNAANNIRTGLKELNSTVITDNKSESTSIKNLFTLWKRLMSGSPLLKGGVEAASGVGWWRGAARGEGSDAGRGARGVHLTLCAARRMATTLLQVPEEWQLVWAGPTAPDAYIREFCHRARAALDRLHDNTHDDQYMPKEVDLRTWLRPSRLVWALRARTAAKQRVRPDQLLLVAKWTDDRKEEASEGIVLRGVRACGCAGGGAGLRAAGAHAPPHAPAPPLALYTLHQDKTTTDGWLEVPMYSSESREELLFTVHMQLDRSFPRETALLNAVALFVAPVD